MDSLCSKGEKKEKIPSYIAPLPAYLYMLDPKSAQWSIHVPDANVRPLFLFLSNRLLDLRRPIPGTRRKQAFGHSVSIHGAFITKTLIISHRPSKDEF